MTNEDKIMVQIQIDDVRADLKRHTTLTVGRLAKRHHELAKLVREKIREIDVALARNHNVHINRYDALADEVHALQAALSHIAKSVL